MQGLEVVQISTGLYADYMDQLIESLMIINGKASI